MEITEVKVRLVKRVGRLKGVASITLANAFAVHDIKIIENESSIFIAMPSRKGSKEGEFKDIAHPITQQARQQVQEAIITKYKQVVSQEIQAEIEAEVAAEQITN